MIRLFSHWLSSRTLFQIAFDVLLLIAIVLGAAWLEQADVLTIAVVTPRALGFALIAVAVNKTIGLYQFDTSRSLIDVLPLASASLLLSAPFAYAIFDEVRERELHYHVLQDVAILALVAIIAIRVSVVRLGLQPNLTRRVMVIGTGAEAQVIQQSLHGDLRLVGFYPTGSKGVNYVPQNCVLSPDVSLLLSTT